MTNEKESTESRARRKDALRRTFRLLTEARMQAYAAGESEGFPVLASIVAALDATEARLQQQFMETP